MIYSIMANYAGALQAAHASEYMRNCEEEADRIICAGMTPEQVQAYMAEKEERRHREELIELERRKVRALEEIAAKPAASAVGAGSVIAFALGLAIGNNQ